MVVLCAEVPLPRRLLLSNGERNGSRRRRRRRLSSFPPFPVPATEATTAQATGRAVPRSRCLQWPLTSVVKSCHHSGAYIAARTSTRGTRSSATCSPFTPSSWHPAAWVLRSCFVLLRTFHCSRCRSCRLTWSVSRRSRRHGSSLHHNDSSREVALLALQQTPRSRELLTFRPLMAQPSMGGVGRGRFAERSRIIHETIYWVLHGWLSRARFCRWLLHGTICWNGYGRFFWVRL